MKTLLLSENFPPAKGGSGRWFIDLYSRLPRDGYVLAVGTHPDQEAFDATHDLDVRRFPLHSDRWDLRNLSALRYYERTVRTLRHLVRREDVTRIHCARCLPEGWAARVLRFAGGPPYDCFVHGEDAETAATSRELSWMVHHVFTGAERLICNSENTARLVAATWRMPSRKIHVLHPGVDASRFVPAPRDPALRWRLGWDGPVILTVGRLQKRKGHDMLIRALPKVRERFPDVLYAIVGDGEERESLMALTRSLGLGANVQFLGDVDDDTLLQCHQQCDLFVLPNRAVGRDIEGFGIVLLEAQACGKAVVAGASGGTAETMRPGETGMVVDCSGSSPLDQVLVSLLANQARRLSFGAAGREWVQEVFDWPRVLPRARALFGEVREEGPRAIVETVGSSARTTSGLSEVSQGMR